MRYINSTKRYGYVAIFFHWVVFILVLCLLLAGFFMGDLSNDLLKRMVYNTHKILGITVLALVVLRATWALGSIKPIMPATLPHWQQMAASSSHFLLYLCLFLMPLSGWIMSAAAGYHPVFFGMPIVLSGVSESEALSHVAKEIHEFTAWVFVVLIVIHTLAALKHHFINKDSILKRMLPYK